MISRSDTRFTRQAGFTLIELLVVLAIVGLAIGMVAARGPLGTRTLSARAAAGDLAQGFREARSDAILRNRATTVFIDLRRHAWRVDDGALRALPPKLDVQVLTVRGLVVPGREAAFRFQPDGSSTGGRVVLADGRRRLEIGVDWISSRVSIVDGS